MKSCLRRREREGEGSGEKEMQKEQKIETGRRGKGGRRGSNDHQFDK